MFKLLKSLLFLPLVFFIYIFRPLKIIQLIEINTTRVAPFISCIEGFLYSKSMKREKLKTKEIFFGKNFISNIHLLKMSKRLIPISLSHTFLRNLKNAIIYFLGKENKNILYMEDYHLNYVVKKYPSWHQKQNSYVNFTFDEKEKGSKNLIKMGINPESKWICIHNRDSKYLKKNFKNMGSTRFGRDWSYHDYRNFSVNSMLPALEYFTQNNFYVLRMGQDVEEKINIKNPKIIDYANSEFRNDFMDIFLLANCKAYFGSDSGISVVPFCFKKPTYNINYSSTEIHIHEKMYKSLFTFKRIKNLVTNKLLPISEILKLSVEARVTPEFYLKNKNLQCVDNSTQEIESFAFEIVKDLNNEKYETSEDKELQEDFWKIYFKYVKQDEENKIKSKISPSFLKKNMDLLA